MALTFEYRWKLTLALALVAAVAAGCVTYQHWRTKRLLQQTFRMGFYAAGTSHFLGADGQAHGSAVDILNEAARRRGIRLQWVYSPEGPDVALTSGKVDLWPVVGDIPERRGRFYISTPWTHDQLRTYFRSRARGLAGGSFQHAENRDVARASKRSSRKNFFPNAQLVTVANSDGQLRAVCAGEADAAILSQVLRLAGAPEGVHGRFDANDHYPDPCPFRSESGPAIGLPGAREAADALRAEMDGMMRDGSLPGIEFQWLDRYNVQTQSYLPCWRRSERPDCSPEGACCCAWYSCCWACR